MFGSEAETLKESLFIPVGHQSKDCKGPFFKLGLLGYHGLFESLISIGIIFFAFEISDQITLTLMKLMHLEGVIPLGYLSLLSFAPVFLVVYLVVKYIQNRPFISVISGAGRFRWGLFFRSTFVFFLLLCLISGVLFFLAPSPFTVVFNAKEWLLQLVPLAVLVWIQTGTEELIFRGFLAQLFGKWRLSTLYAILLPSLLFGVVHFPNIRHFAGDWTMVLYFFLIGPFLALVAWRSNGIERSWGIHFAINFTGFAIFVPENQVLKISSVIIQLPSLGSTSQLIPMIILCLAYLFFEFGLFKSQQDNCGTRL